VLGLLSVLVVHLFWRKTQIDQAPQTPTSHKAEPETYTKRKPRPFTLVPRKGVGLLSFGDTTEQVRAALGVEDPEWAQQTENQTAYSYKQLGSVIEVSKDDKVIAFKFFKPAMPYFDGEDLLGLPFQALAMKFSELDKTTAMNEDGMIHAPALGIAAYAPNAQTAPHEPPEFIHFSCKGYRNMD